MQKWKVVESEYIFQDPPWLTVRRDKCELANGKKVSAFYVNEYPEWVNAFALTKDNQVVMVKQYRHGIGEFSIELPGGVVDKGEELETAIKRELKEETGYEFDNLEYLGKICANPSTTNNFMHMYLTTGGEKTADQNLDDTEELEVLFQTIDEVKQLVKENKIIQSLHVNCIIYALQKLGEIKL